MRELERRAAKGTIWAVIQNSSSEIIAFLIFLVMARLLAPKDFGLIAFAGVFIAFTQTFLDQGLTGAIVQRAEIDPEHLDSAFWANLIFSLVLVGALVFFSGFVVFISREERTARILPWLALNLPLNALIGVQQAIYTRKLQFKPLTLRVLIGNTAGGIIGIVMAVVGCGVWSLVGQQIGTGLFGLLTLWSTSEWRPRFRFSFRHLRDLESYALPVTGAAFLDFFNRRADDFLIGFYLGPIALGYYSVAYRILLTMTRVITLPFNSVAFATFSRLQHHAADLKRYFHQVTRTMCYISFPAFIGIIVIEPEFIAVFAGNKWLPSAPILQVLMLIGILHSVTFFCGALRRAVGKATWNVWFTLAGATTNVIAFFLVVRYGTLWVAISYVISGYFWFPLNIWLTEKIFPDGMAGYFKLFIHPFIASLAMSSAILALKYALPVWFPHLPVLILSTLTGAFVYGTVCWLLSPEEMRGMLDFLVNLRKGPGPATVT